MQRRGFEIPLMIGGATTSRAHTAVKVDGKYDGPVVWVKDASRSVPTLAALLSDAQRPKLLADVKADYDSLRERHAAKHDRPMLTLQQARDNRTPIEWDGYEPPAPKEPGIHVLEAYDLAELRDYIDWQPFFNAWEMKGKFPDILHNPTTGETARALYDDAQAMLDKVIAEKWLTANARVRLLPGERGGRRHRGLHRRLPLRGRSPPCTTSASRVSTARASPTGRWATSWRPARPGCPTTSAPSRSPPGWAPRTASTRSRRTTTTTPRSCSSRSPTGSPRPSRSGSTSGSAPSSGATSPTRTSTTRP